MIRTLKSELSSKGVRPLKHRVAVYRYLVENPTHPTVDEIYCSLKTKMNSISRTTVYNVLNLLSEKGVIQQLTIDKTEMRYDANVENHIHFRCKVCNEVFDLHTTPFPSITIPAEFEIDQTEINVSGICPTCAKN
ncbi:MAG: Fur family transcriptional regulator [Sphaerochaetaceae bacterium]|jgi:Fur family peroxide stress response transcriptional regulator